MQEFLKAYRLKKFEAIQHVLVPRSSKFTPRQKAESVRSINEFIASKGTMVAIKICLLFHLIDALSLIFFLKTFSSLDSGRKKQIMNFLFDSRLALFRKAFWGINTLAKLGVYTQASIYPDLGYELEIIRE